MRLSITPEDEREPLQREVAEALMSRLNRKPSGPFLVLLEHPELCRGVLDLGCALRFTGELPGNLRELAILLGARHHNAPYEWNAHAPLAERQGFPPEAIEAIRLGQRPAKLSDEEAVVYDTVQEMLHTYTLSDDTLARATAAIGQKRLIELTALCGYYVLISLMLNVAGAQPPKGAPELPPI